MTNESGAVGAKKGRPAPKPCAHESVTTADGHGAFCRFCGETTR
jgi:hypothetical protein